MTVQQSPRDRLRGSRQIVLLAGPGDATDIVANWLDEHTSSSVILVAEEAQSRLQLTRRRIKRIGWGRTFGQVAFVTIAMPVLRKRGQKRRNQILAEFGMDDTIRPPDFRVDSVNSPGTIALLSRLEPSVVVVNGTRIISSLVLNSLSCPVINTHAGLTPGYRGVHGGYWALAEGHPEEVGTTLHMVDSGIDTGQVLARARFDTSPTDSIATYPYLHLAAGLPLLTDGVQKILDGQVPIPVGDEPQSLDSRLFSHPTLWEYIRLWAHRGVH